MLAPKKCVPDPELEERFNRAMLQFAKLTERGEDSREKADCLKTIKEVASKGLAAAQYNLGIIHHTGQGVPQSDALAVEWYRKAADQGYAPAQHNLGCAYGNGQGVPQSFPEALRWLRKAHAQGQEEAAGAIETVLRLQRQQKGAAAAASRPPQQPPPTSPSPSPVPIGTRVELHGLKAKKMNRQRGVVARFDAGSGRCVVKLEDGREFKCKVENLKTVTAKAATTATKKKEGGR